MRAILAVIYRVESLPFLASYACAIVIGAGAIPYALATPYVHFFDSGPVAWTVRVVPTNTYRQEPQGYRLASISPEDPEHILTKPTVLRTPFGTTLKTTVNLSGISSELVGFIRKVQSQCGQVTVISGFRRSGVPGTCHASRQALDYQIRDPACALKIARQFRGGHSVDYYGVQAISRGMPAHYHVSICSREMGARFNHRGSRKRYAKRRS